MKDKKSFVLYKDQYEPIKNLTAKQKGAILDAIFIYHIKGEMVDLDPVCKMAFKYMEQAFVRDDEKYAAMVKRNKKNAEKRWAKEAAAKNATRISGIRSHPVGTRNADSDSGTGSDSGF